MSPEMEPRPAADVKRRSSCCCTCLKCLVAAITIVFFARLLYGDSPGSQNESCDLFSGEWIPNISGPSYSNVSCNFISAKQNCLKNGRPDNSYLYWRWKPKNCDLPPFDSERFLKLMGNKSWALIGDSLFRNQIESLICLLAEVEEPLEVYHDETYRSRTWFFSSHNFTLAIIWAPFLLKADIFENNDGKSNYDIQLYLDVLETVWTTNYHMYDYVVISGGQWFLKTTIMWENNMTIGCHNCGSQNLKELGIYYPYRKALQLVFHFITTSSHKPFVVLRTWSPDHFEYGEWFSGGVCNRTVPYKDGEYSGKEADRLMRAIEVEEFKKAAAIGSKNGIHMKLLDVYNLSLLRPDGHPGPYRTFHPFEKDKNAKVQNDCLHWCLPGPVDTWNDLMMEIMFNEGDLRSAS